MNFTIDMHFRFTNTEKTAATVTGQVAMHFTGTGCEGVPDQCMTLNLTGSKVGPVPAGGCS